jgi:hypothetical protein
VLCWAYWGLGGLLIKTTNALGHSETKTFDAKTGNILTLTGPNSLTTELDPLVVVVILYRLLGDSSSAHW